jgi:nitroreductase
MGGAADCHIAATYAMLAAESLGLGSCMLGTTEALGRVKSFKSKYGIPPKNKIGLGLALGYSAETFQRGVRRRLASVAFA